MHKKGMQRGAKNVVPLDSAPPVRRRIRSEEWVRLVDAWRASGLSARAFAAQAGVRAATLLWWSSELARRERGAGGAKQATVGVTFLPVSVRAPLRQESASEVCARVEVGKFVVQVLNGSNMPQVAELCRALSGEAAC